MSIVKEMPWLESVDAKLDRAREHVENINRQINEFINATKDHFIAKNNPQTDETWLVWYIDEPLYPPLSVSVEIGEFLYNLRSALDNLVCALVRTVNNSSSCAGRGFPIHTDCNKFDADIPRMLKGVPAGARTLIQGLQPYSRGQQAADVDPLNILNLLRNRDTHRALNLAVGYNRNTKFLVSDAATGNTLVYVVNPSTIYLAHGAQTIPLPLRAVELPPKVNVKAQGSRGVGFLEEGPWGERPVQEVLVACLQYVEDRVVARFKPFFC